MTLLDAYALVAFVAEEPAANDVEELLREGACRVVAVNLAEAIDACRRVHAMPGSDIRRALDPLTLSNTLAVVASDEREAWSAADLRARYYHKKDCRVSIADCFLLAHSLGEDDALATADPDLAHVARAEGAQVIALPDSDGRTPS